MPISNTEIGSLGKATESEEGLTDRDNPLGTRTRNMMLPSRGETRHLLPPMVKDQQQGR